MVNSSLIRNKQNREYFYHSSLSFWLYAQNVLSSLIREFALY